MRVGGEVLIEEERRRRDFYGRTTHREGEKFSVGSLGFLNSLFVVFIYYNESYKKVLM